MSGRVRLKRIYAPAGAEDGVRVLVDRIWPRGILKAEARVDIWMKDVAPSTRLRKWYGHRPELWLQFRRRYLAELADNSALRELQALARRGDVTLLYASRDETRNNAAVLAPLLRRSGPDSWGFGRSATARRLGTPHPRHHMSGMRNTRATVPPDEDPLKAKAIARWENEGGAPGAEQARMQSPGSRPRTGPKARANRAPG